MNVETLRDLFVTEVHRAYGMESRLVEELTKLERDVDVDALDDHGDPAVRDALREAIADHQAETREQVERLEQVLAALDRPKEPRATPALDGLVDEKELFNNVVLNDELRPLYYLDAGRQIEQLEIAAYERLLRLGARLDVPDESLDLLERNLEEEQAALEALESLSESEAVGTLLDGLAPSGAAEQG